MAAAVASCGSAPAAKTVVDAAIVRGVATPEPAADPRPLAAADTGFGLDVMRAWCAQNPGQNLVFSPSTLASALGMAYLGARGATASAMARALDLPAGASLAALEAELQARIEALGRLDGPGVTLGASDQVWADPTLTTLRSYLNAVATGYHAGVAQAPFSTDPAKAAAEINQAISAATHGHISQLVNASMLDNVGWVLTSALYLNAKWATPFDPVKTAAGAVRSDGREGSHGQVHERRRLPLRLRRRLAGGLAPLPRRQAHDDRAAAAAGVSVVRAAESGLAGVDHRIA